MQTVTLKQTGSRLPADIQTPISLFLGLVGSKQGFLLESAEVDGRLGRYSVLGWNYRMRLSCKDGKLEVAVRDDRLEGFKALAGAPYLEGVRQAMAHLEIAPEPGYEDMPPITRGLYGYFGYGMARLFEPKLADHIEPEAAEACLVLPGAVAVFDHLYQRLSVLNTVPGVKIAMDKLRGSENPELGPIHNVPEEGAYKRGVERAKQYIMEGECIQTVLSTRFQAPFTGEPFDIYRNLRQINPSPYMFFMRLPGVSLCGSSPEMLVRCSGGVVQTCPIAGTRRRGADEGEDKALADELLADPKERAEHVMLVDLGRNDLGRIAAPGSVEVESFMQVERFSHVMHLTSYVKAKLAEGKDALDVLAAAFPAGTVSGAPKVRAMEIVAELEGLSRGPYAGAVGWLGLDKDSVDLDTGILIRSLWVKDGMVHWQAGAGIVADSDPDAEWQECQNKAKVLKQALTTKGGGDVLAYR